MSECSCAGLFLNSGVSDLGFCDETVLHSTAQSVAELKLIIIPSYTNAIANQAFYFFTISCHIISRLNMFFFFLCFKLINKHFICFWTLIEV